ncbi:MAG: hypothetical protein KatS3mg109_2256 [Pirellulaceae bacterium]|nr:MAG: hypothetical protein KatS3mg109_2256 [Pirellulaceae bacterium]
MTRVPAWITPLLAGVMLIGMVAGCTSQQPALPSPTPSPVAHVSGADLFFGRAPLAGGVPCMTCHTLDASEREGVGPNLAGVGRRAGERMPGVSAREYLERSIRAHDEFIVPGHQGGIVRAVVGDDYGNLLPDEQIAALVDFLLQQQAVAGAGGTVTLSPTATPTASPTLFPTATATPTLSPTTAATSTVSPLPSSTATPSPQVTATASATVAPAPTFTSTPTSVPPTAAPLALPTDTPLPAPTPTPPPLTPMTVPEPTLVPPVASEAGLEQYLGCVNCHNLHPQQVSMPHPLNPTCNDCHRGSPSRVGCPTCHNMHQIDNRHEPVPDLPCNACHTS